MTLDLMAEGHGSLIWFSIRATRMLSLDITHHTTQWVWLLVDFVPRYALFRVPVDQHQQEQFSYITFLLCLVYLYISLTLIWA